MNDRFRHDDAAYVLGALEAGERTEFEAHLATCPQCSARVREIADLPDLLGAVPSDEVEDRVPDTLLPGLLHRAALERRRRHRVSAALGALTAACLVAVAVLLWPSGSTPALTPRAMSAVILTPVHASATLADRPWGTEIDLVCSYDGGTAPPAGYTYGLIVRGRDGSTDDLGTWTLAAGKDTRFASGTALHRDQIASIQITGPSGQPILQLRT